MEVEPWGRTRGMVSMYEDVLKIRGAVVWGKALIQQGGGGNV